MEEKDTYQRVAIPMTDKQAHEAFACETCKGFDGALQYLKGFMDDVFTNGLIDGNPVSPKDHKEYHKHLNLVAHPDCDGQCVTGETMSITCPCCKDRVYFNYDCFLPTEIKCMHCGADLTGNSLAMATHEKQVTIRRIIKNHNKMRGDLDILYPNREDKS